MKITSPPKESYTTSGISYWDYENSFNPADIKQFYGITLVIANGSEYKITGDGRINGRKSIDGAKIKLIAGIPNGLQLLAKAHLDTNQPKSNLEAFVKDVGRIPGNKRTIAIVLTDESAKETGRYGIVIPHLKEIK